MGLRLGFNAAPGATDIAWKRRYETFCGAP
jgi:hypothetical protein